MIYKTLKIRGDATFEDSIDQQIVDGWAIWFMSPVRAGTYYVTFCKPEKVLVEPTGVYTDKTWVEKIS